MPERIAHIVFLDAFVPTDDKHAVHARSSARPAGSGALITIRQQAASVSVARIAEGLSGRITSNWPAYA